MGGKMDFGDILNQWDTIESDSKKKTKAQIQEENKPRPRKANAPRLEKKEEYEPVVEKVNYNSAHKANPMDVWLRHHGVIDKDALAIREEERNKSKDREYLKKRAVDATVDLHGLTRDEAWERLDLFVADCQRRGFEKILIVHGKGNHSQNQQDVSVLATMVRQFIECDIRLGASGHPDKKLGGNGATWVFIKKK